MIIPFLLVILFCQILGQKGDLRWCSGDSECLSGYCANLPGHSYDGKKSYNSNLCHCRDDSYCDKMAGTGPSTQYCSKWDGSLKNHWCFERKDLLTWCGRDSECLSGYCAHLPGHSYDGDNVYNGNLCHCRDDSYCDKRAGTGHGTQYCSKWDGSLKNHWCFERKDLLRWCIHDSECLSGYCDNLPGHSYDGKTVYNSNLCHCRDDSYCDQKTGVVPGTQFCAIWPNHPKNHWCLQKLGLGSPCQRDGECVDTFKCSLHLNEYKCTKRCSSSSDCENGDLCVGGGCSCPFKIEEKCYRCEGGKYPDLSTEKKTGKLTCLTCPVDHWCNLDIKTACPSSYGTQSSGQLGQSRCVKNDCHPHETVEYISWDKTTCLIEKAWYRIKIEYSEMVSEVDSRGFLMDSYPIFHNGKERQHFRFIRNGNFYMIENRYTSNFLTFQIGNLGKVFVKSQAKGGVGQIWDLRRQGSEYYAIRNKKNGLVFKGSIRPGEIELSYFYGEKNQLWTLEKVEEF